MYTYVFEVTAEAGEALTASVPEHLLTPDLRSLADLVLSLDR